MGIEGWKYYNHAAIPTTAPHIVPDLISVKNRHIFKRGVHGGTAFLARWTEEWDCEDKTEWWYVIKDTPFDISKLKAKRRYEINKGIKNFEVKTINPNSFADDIYRVTVEAYSGWSEKYRPSVTEEGIQKSIKSWHDSTVFGGFDRATGKLMAYAVLSEYDSYIEFSILRTVPDAEKLGINAAMVAGILEKYRMQLEKGIYINDGTRAIRHETAFQDYLEKYFEFRKAYCKLEIAYNTIIGITVKILYPFRDKIGNKSSIGSKITAILKMEEIRRNCQKGSVSVESHK